MIEQPQSRAVFPIDCIQSARLLLRPISAGDAAVLQQLGSDDEVFAFIPLIDKPFDAASWTGEKLAAREMTVRHVVCAGEARRVVGYVQIGRRRNLHWELGYWLGSAFWGMGYAREATATALLAHLSLIGEQVPVFASSSPDNPASLKVLNALGFVSSTGHDLLSDVPSGFIDFALLPPAKRSEPR